MQLDQIQRTIVLVGNFNPAIFQPVWFEKHSLLPADEMVDLYTEKVVQRIPEIGFEMRKGNPFQITNDQAIMTFKSFSLNISRDKFVLTVLSDNVKIAVEFIKKTFLILKDTPIIAYGLNFSSHINFNESYNDIIKNLFEEKQPTLNAFGSKVEYGFSAKFEYNDFTVGYQIEKSIQVENALYLISNYHYNIRNNSDELIEIKLKERFTQALDHYISTVIKNLGTLKI